MQDAILADIRGRLRQIADDGLTKVERSIAGPQGGKVTLVDGAGPRRAINLCSNNYLGLADDPDIILAAKQALDAFGFGMASVRFICGTQTLHRDLEQAIARFVGKDDAILFSSCFDANAAIFETLLGPDDVIFSDSLNHASIIDGIRLCKARLCRFDHGSMEQLESQLASAEREGSRFRLIVTDGVFSMDGFVADLGAICDLAEKYGATVLVDDSHGLGHLGAGGRGTPELTGVGDRVDIISGTLGKTLGGGMGGFIAAAQPVVDLLRQRARPYLFSNSIAPPLAAGAIKAIEIAEGAAERRRRLERLTNNFRSRLEKAGYTLLPGTTPIIPVMVGDPHLGGRLQNALSQRGVYVTAFSYPVVPHGKARIRVQMSTALEDTDVETAIDAFIEAGKETGLLS